VAGKYFGFGSSGQPAPLTLKAAGIPCIVARSFARTFYRTGVNLGVLPIECELAAEEFDTLEIDPEEGKLIVNHERVYTFHRFPPLLLDIIREKGLLNYYKTHGML
jgi:3-isopropylmalate dehydratase small subunit